MDSSLKDKASEEISLATEYEKRKEWLKAKASYTKAGEIMIKLCEIETKNKNEKFANEMVRRAQVSLKRAEKCRQEYKKEISMRKKKKKIDIPTEESEESKEYIFEVQQPTPVHENEGKNDFEVHTIETPDTIVPNCWDLKVKKKPKKKEKKFIKPVIKEKRNVIEKDETTIVEPKRRGIRKGGYKPSYALHTKSSGKKNKKSSEPIKNRNIRKKSPIGRRAINQPKSPQNIPSSNPSSRGKKHNPRVIKRKRGTRKKKSPVKIVKPNPKSEFSKACCEGELHIVTTTVSSAFFEIEEEDYKYGLHFAAYFERFEVCKFLIQTGIYDLDCKYHGAKVIEYAQDEIVKLALRVFNLLHTELQFIIGLSDVKEHLYALANKIILDKKRERMGHSISKKTYDMIFTGNPGTGKTSIAKVICKMYFAFKIITKPDLKTVQRGDLVAGFIGKTALKTRDVIEKQKGGILLVDEAYRLSHGGEKDFGKEAIEELMQAMNGESGIIFIFAGYKKDMERYVRSNEGLFRRIAYRMEFCDFSSEEISKILEIKVNKSEYFFSDDLKEENGLVDIIKICPVVLRSKMNGGLAQKLMEYAIDELNNDLSLDAKGDDLLRIERKHLLKAMKKHYSV